MQTITVTVPIKRKRLSRQLGRAFRRLERNLEDIKELDLKHESQLECARRSEK